ncbi:MAG TPA: alpha-amylase family glycosyl hydrolase [Candidatus Sulfomarinibacteraceae bacterium]|nr:alpha-amylase family glycosyl hydrolase [Candidatus Sulfomarinibacteraceae bacterium]
MDERIGRLLTFVYGAETAQSILPRLEELLDEFRGQILARPVRRHFDHRDTVLITYGDILQHGDEPPLQTLRRFLQASVGGLVGGVHLLPFFPYSSDDGFAVIDYQEVDPALGDWTDVEAFGRSFHLMFDAVINHISRQSEWFQAFKRGEAPYTDFFVTVEPGADLSTVFRPRALPLLTPVETAQGTKQVWTTFSADQIDLNYRSPELLLEILRVLLSYVTHGAQMIRLDAIAFMWKEPGTSCIHRPRTHALIQLMRAVLDEIAPQVALITETNVPHEENISYFGDGQNEAQMVYNFSLPPLTLRAFHTGQATTLARWARGLTVPSDRVTFFNFLASHDGIGLTPARGILSEGEIEALVQRVQALGGYVSYKTNADGTQSAYELNINYLDALGDPDKSPEEELAARRFLASQAIMLALRGVPGIYFHSLFGSRNWREGVARTGQKRAINRQKLQRDQLQRELQGGLRRRVFGGYRRLLRVRTTEMAFHPYGQQRVLDLHPAVLAVERARGLAKVLCLHNVSREAITLDLPGNAWVDLLSEKALSSEGVTLPPYGVLWLKRHWMEP